MTSIGNAAEKGKDEEKKIEVKKCSLMLDLSQIGDTCRFNTERGRDR